MAPGLKLGGEVDLEVMFGELGEAVDERLREFIRSRRAIGRHLEATVSVPASLTAPLLIDCKGPSPSLLWKLRQACLWGDQPYGGSPPISQSAVDLTSGVVANAQAQVTMPAVAGKTNILNGIEVTGLGATAGSTITGTIAGVQGGTEEFFVTVPAGVGLPITPVNITFPGGLQASGPGVAIVVTVPAFGAGNVNAELNTQGVLQQGGTIGSIVAAIFKGSPTGLPQDLTTTLPDVGGVIAPNVVIPTAGPVAFSDVIARANEHVYALVAGSALSNLTYNQLYMTLDVLEALDTPETLSWL